VRLLNEVAAVDDDRLAGDVARRLGSEINQFRPPRPVPRLQRRRRVAGSSPLSSLAYGSHFPAAPRVIYGAASGAGGAAKTFV
jgi:hypothetical protein